MRSGSNAESTPLRCHESDETQRCAQGTTRMKRVPLGAQSPSLRLRPGISRVRMRSGGGCYDRKGVFGALVSGRGCNSCSRCCVSSCARLRDFQSKHTEAMCVALHESTSGMRRRGVGAGRAEAGWARARGRGWARGGGGECGWMWQNAWTGLRVWLGARRGRVGRSGGRPVGGRRGDGGRKGGDDGEARSEVLK